MTTSLAALTALAEDPERFISPPEGAQRTVSDHHCLIVGPERRWAGVCELRVPGAGQVASVVAEVRAAVAGIGFVVWNVGSSATPEGLPDLLREHGLRDPDPPMDPVVAAMTLDHEPPGGEGAVVVRRITTLEEHVAGVEIMLAAAHWEPGAAADERARAQDTFERRQRRGGYQWLAWLEDRPVAFALADRADAGLFLAGGSTLPDARGRGCYRALVRARWDEAVRLGLPGLAVQAQYGTSAPILRRLGFAQVATVHTLQDSS